MKTKHSQFAARRDSTMRVPGALWSHAIASASRAILITLATRRTGRIALHLLVALKTGHFVWHWHGIVRELTGA